MYRVERERKIKLLNIYILYVRFSDNECKFFHQESSNGKMTHNKPRVLKKMICSGIVGTAKNSRKLMHDL